MITTLLQSVGVVFTILILAAVALVSMYISYVVAVGVVIVSLLFITYHALTVIRKNK